jgi:hypothetical protein
MTIEGQNIISLNEIFLQVFCIQINIVSSVCDESGDKSRSGKGMIAKL